MKKIIRQIGTSIGIIFNKEECQVLDIEVGDIANIDDIVIEKKKKGDLK
jgi:hypothetical protein